MLLWLLLGCHFSRSLWGSWLVVACYIMEQIVEHNGGIDDLTALRVTGKESDFFFPYLQKCLSLVFVVTLKP